MLQERLKRFSDTGGMSEPTISHAEMHSMAADEIERLRAALRQALGQWRMYADMVEGNDGFDLATEESPEANLYREARKLLDGDEQSETEKMVCQSCGALTVRGGQCDCTKMQRLRYMTPEEVAADKTKIGAEQSAPEPKLDELLAGITEENRHDET